MNERIKELMAQAVTFYLDPDSKQYEAQVTPEDLELFAELIVKECISALDYADGSVHHSECLLEHFGVEE